MRRYQRKRGFHRTLVLLLTLVMLASVCFPGLRASAEAETADVVVKAGEKAEYSVRGAEQIDNVTIPQDSGLSFTYVDGTITVDATKAVSGTYTVNFLYNTGISGKFTVQVNAAPEDDQIQPLDDSENLDEEKTEQGSEDLIEQGTEDKTEEGTEGKTEQGTEGETEEKTEGETEEDTESKTEEGTEGKTEEGTEGKTEQGTEGETEEKTEGKTEEGTEGKTEQGTEGETEQEEGPTPESENGAALFGLDGVSLYADTAIEIEQGKSGSVNSGTLWYVNSTRIQQNGKTVTNTGITGSYSNGTCTVSVSENTPAGTYTVQFGYSAWGSWNTVYSIDVTVTEASKEEGAIVYFLKTPTSDPDSNATNQWGSAVTVNGQNATVNTTGATWVGDKNITSEVSQYIISWPDGTSGATWTIQNNEIYSTWFEEVYSTWKTELEKTTGITDLQLSDIDSITVTPYKISKGNGTNPDKHIDCIISVTCSKAYVARFNVQKPGETGYTNVSAQNKKIVNGQAETIVKYADADKVPETIVYNGITYKFDGWYNEAGVKVSDDSWPYSPSNIELADGTVNFYAHYVPATTSITVTKTVTGNMGDYRKSFEFTYKVGTNGTDSTFSLAHNGSKELSNLSIGQTLYIKENSAGYTPAVTYSVNGATPTAVTDEEGWYAIPIQAGTTVSVTNDKTATIDTGIFTDTAPYIILFSVAAVGAAVLLAKKRRYQV